VAAVAAAPLRVREATAGMAATTAPEAAVGRQGRAAAGLAGTVRPESPVTTHQPLIVDRWTPFDYKRGVTREFDPHGWLAPTWVGEHRRRLESYRLLESYRANASRNYLSTDDDEQRRNRREYGDSNLIVQTIVDAVIGDDATVVGEEGDPTLEAMQTWAEQERVLRKFFAWEEKAVNYGDAVLTVTWDATKDRPTVTLYDPGFYFPDLDSMMGDYPTRVCLAWEWEEDNGEKVVRYLRRIRYELVADEVPRRYPWERELSYITCLMTDTTWDMSELREVEDVLWGDPPDGVFEINADGFEINRLDIDIDFIPVVHLPNTISEEEHFGESSLATVLQIIDDLISADTDLEGAAAVVGFPPLAADGSIAGEEGATKTIDSYGPGTVFSGKLSYIDTSSSLDALLKYTEALLKRLHVNSRVSEAATGRIKPSDISSGVEMRLHFAAMERMINKMRLTREEKRPLVFKFARRLMMLAGQVRTVRDEPEVTLQSGSFIPNNLAGTITAVAAAVSAGLMSRETAVRHLVEAGADIDDAEAEIEAIQAGDFAGALMLQQALGDELAAYEYLGVEVPDYVRDRVENPPDPRLDPVVPDDEDDDET
jgi:hypothetical protein